MIRKYTKKNEEFHDALEEQEWSANQNDEIEEDEKFYDAQEELDKVQDRDSYDKQDLTKKDTHIFSNIFFDKKGIFQKNLYLGQGKSSTGEKITSWTRQTSVELALNLINNSVKNNILKLQKCFDKYHEYNSNKTPENYNEFIQSLNDVYDDVVQPQFQSDIQSLMNGRIVTTLGSIKQYLKDNIISQYKSDDKPINIDITKLKIDEARSLANFINQNEYFVKNDLKVSTSKMPDANNILYVESASNKSINTDDVSANIITSLTLNILVQKFLSEQTAGKYWSKMPDSQIGEVTNQPIVSQQKVKI